MLERCDKFVDAVLHFTKYFNFRYSKKEQRHVFDTPVEPVYRRTFIVYSRCDLCSTLRTINFQRFGHIFIL